MGEAEAEIECFACHTDIAHGDLYWLTQFPDKFYCKNCVIVTSSSKIIKVLKCIWCKKEEARIEFDEWEEMPGDPLSMEGGVFIKCILCQMQSPIRWYSVEDKDSAINGLVKDYENLMNKLNGE